MPPRSQWVVTCNHCQQSFTHSEIPEARNLMEYFYPPKPEMPLTGQQLQCPHCRRLGNYLPSDLRYQAEPG